ncbi:MAG: hypothetical protein KF821_11165 [Anaerolineales bacterium]|jgi:hypothetical protein|nr:hypothetical protein [Anaerolineales bacterium]MBX3006371.1 hypothetical protein [Anaerolineales bacterium]MCW5839083.1 hypothetical protein [Anaerolineales bacterium]
MVNKGLLRNFSVPGFIQRNLVWGLLVVAALLAFELFNFSTTEFALHDLLGDLRFGGVAWASILAVAFCAIDFAGIAHMFANHTDLRSQQLSDTWYLFAAWLLAATMNATLTWWGVSIALVNSPALGEGLLDMGTLLAVVPAFVAVFVWLIRVLTIGTLISSGGKLFTQSQRSMPPTMRRSQPAGSRAAQPAMYNGLVGHSQAKPVQQHSYQYEDIES